MSDSLDVLRAPETETKAEEKVTSELEKFTHRSWWCRKFHDKFMYTVGYTWVCTTHPSEFADDVYSQKGACNE